MHVLLFCAALTLSQTPDAGIAQPEGRPRLAVTDLVAQGTKPEEAAAITDAVVQSLAGRRLFDVVSGRDVEALISAERRKQLLGVCESSPEQCAADVASASLARFVLSGQLAKVGSAYQLSLQMVDTQKSQTVSRATRLAGDLETLRSVVPYAAAEATGSPLPPPPSRVLPITLMAVGGGTFFAGGVVGLLALSRQSLLNDELCPAGAVAGQRCTGVNLHPREFYVQRDAELSTQKALSVGLMLGGAALLGVGLWLMPPAERAGVAAFVVPQPNGVAVVGTFE